MSVRKIGVEEELLLVDPATGALSPVSDQALRHHHDTAATDGGEPSFEDPGGGVEQELFREQIETGTRPWQRLSDLDADVRRCRAAAGRAARDAGAAAVAVSTPILADAGYDATRKQRYLRIVNEFGEIGRQGVVCGMHVHVDVSGDAEGVQVLDRVRPWLPVLLAVSANSPYWRGTDTGYASWRSQVWGRWPTAGPAEPFGDVETYQAVAEAMVTTGAAIDRGMLYYDARLAETYATVELRVADVCTEIEDTVLVAALGRALVETAAREWQAGKPPAAYRTDLLRAAHWQAARSGLAGQLVHPIRRTPTPARAVFDALVEHCRPALDDAGDTDLVVDAFERMLARGPGASRQRAVAEATGSLEAVVADLRDRTEDSWQGAEV